jgi:DMSO/TMAO reductase YedYZ molybdopterin-dependent catalytic subunit
MSAKQDNNEESTVVESKEGKKEKGPRLSKKAKFLKDNNFTNKVNEKNITINATKGYSVKIDGLSEQEAICLITKYLLKN